MANIHDEERTGRHVTDVLMQCGFRSEFNRIPKDKREYYMLRGKYVHEATEHWDRGTLNGTALDPVIAPYLEGYKLFRTEIGGAVDGIELPVESKVWNYKGRLDRIYRDTQLCPGLILMDIKTSSADPATRLQTAAYRLAWRELKRRGRTPDIRRGYVSLQKSGKYKCELYDHDEADEAGWISCLMWCNGKQGMNAWRSRNGLPPVEFVIAEVIRGIEDAE